MTLDILTAPQDPDDADTVAVGVFSDESPHSTETVADTPTTATTASDPTETDVEPSAGDGLPSIVRRLIASGEARSSFKALAVAHEGDRRWLIVGLGARDDFSPERARVVAVAAHDRARELSTRALHWRLPDSLGAPHAAALVEGTVLAGYHFDLYKSETDATEDRPPDLQRLTVEASLPADLQNMISAAVVRAAITATAVNGARDLQNRPPNDLTPTALGLYARQLATELPSLQVEVEGREGIVDRGMGAFAAVAQGSYQEPALITIRYSGGPNLDTPLLAFVGKAVTFDSGGISLKPGPKMADMKFDMSGGAAVLGAVAAIARLRLPVRLIAVIGATENLPSGRSVKPGDIVTAANGKTIEVNNTDAEGRLVLADCLHHAVGQGAERIVDLATLTGAVTVALGSTYAGLIANEDSFADRVTAAGQTSGEIVWRLPLHKEYDELIRGRYADLDNAPEGRKAGTIVGGAFLANFVSDVPWAHLDIAGSAWDLNRAYAPKGASGYGVRLLVDLARFYTE